MGDKKVEKRKSMVFKCNLNPVFDEKFEYTLPVEQLREAALEVMIMDFDNIGRNELIGKITISCKCIIRVRLLQIPKEHLINEMATFIKFMIILRVYNNC